MFHKILIANRGEIALRIIRTCREMGIRTVVAHSQADAGSLPVRLADESICIGPAEARQSYLNIPSIISAASITDSEAIHPGYGLLSENAAFAEICRACGITFIGPAPEAIRLMGDKAQARAMAKQAGAPVVPGSEGPLEGVDEAQALADTIGYPVMVKAAAGGGGRGMRIVRARDMLAQAFATCQAEAAQAFGSSELYLEKFVEEARHVEVQVLGDRNGIRVHLGERDCSVQRRHQKLLEESPASAISEATRAGLYKAALTVANSVNYVSAGTVEFLVARDGTLLLHRDEHAHPGRAPRHRDGHRHRPRPGADPHRLGRAARLQAARDHAARPRHRVPHQRRGPRALRPLAGHGDGVAAPGGYGVRVDSHLMPGAVVPPYYDSLIAKIIVHGRDRAEAIARMQRALAETVVGASRPPSPTTRSSWPTPPSSPESTRCRVSKSVPDPRPR